MKKSGKWLQVGNFLLCIERKSQVRYIVCRSVAGGWNIRWREDTMMFAMMKQLLDNGGVEDYLHSLLSVMYVVTSYPHDLISLGSRRKMPFMEGVAKLVSEEGEYERSLVSEPTVEQDDEALAEVVRMREVEEELERIDEENE